MTAYDARGAEIKPGDYVIWHDNRASNSSGLYLVEDVKSRVKLYRPGWKTWVTFGSVIVVDSLPYVEDTLNTPRTQNEKEKNEGPENPPHPRAARKR